ncbi:MAG: hypothetical protein MI924_11040 [Chloroflexales bacterium]|nr:hypothetical protein [Chloroflexales bacterium]
MRLGLASLVAAQSYHDSAAGAARLTAAHMPHPGVRLVSAYWRGRGALSLAAQRLPRSQGPTCHSSLAPHRRP